MPAFLRIGLQNKDEMQKKLLSGLLDFIQREIIKYEM